MRIAVTGANGYLGSAICDRLVADGHEVLAVVRETGSAPPRTAECVIDDIATADWSSTLATSDAVVHLAARVHVMGESAADDLGEFLRVNTHATTRLAEEAAAAGVATFVFMSSIAAQGARERDEPWSIDDADAPLTPYGVSKREAEQSLKARTFPSMAVTVLRIPMVYGPGAGGNFARLASLVERGIPLPFSRIRNRRSMIAVWNVADLVVTHVTSSASGYRTVLAADDTPTSTPELIRAVAAGLGTRARLFPLPSSLLRLAGRLIGRRAEVDRLIGSLEVSPSSTDSSFSWTPPVDTATALRRTAERWSDAKTP